MSEVHRVVEQVAREARGRLLAHLAVRTRDLPACEDALADAFVQALQTWPRDGVPAEPVAWLRTAARNGLLSRFRHAGVVAGAADVLRLLLDEREDGARAGTLPDDRLPLLFVCAHPAIDAAARAPLMMQVVLGMDAAQVAPAFLVSPSSMAKRLVRAKEKIRRAGITFELPGRDEWAPRLEVVLEAIYGAYGRSWDHALGPEPWVGQLRDEAVALAELMAAALPDEPEALALLALLLHCEARAPARVDVEGVFIPLAEQDTARWDHARIDRAEALLLRAARTATPGRFKLEAAIQSCHAARRRLGVDAGSDLLSLYGELLARHPTVGAALAQVAAVAEVRGPDAALALLERPEMASLRGHQPYQAVRAEVLARLGRLDEAREACELALGLTADPGVRRWLARRRDRMRSGEAQDQRPEEPCGRARAGD